MNAHVNVCVPIPDGLAYNSNMFQNKPNSVTKQLKDLMTVFLNLLNASTR